MAAPLGFGNGYVISYHFILDVILPIHVNHNDVSKKSGGGGV